MDINIVDFHSHILPRIDDGSHSVEESIKMLEMEAAATDSSLIYFFSVCKGLPAAAFVPHADRAKIVPKENTSAKKPIKILFFISFLLFIIYLYSSF